MWPQNFLGVLLLSFTDSVYTYDAPSVVIPQGNVVGTHMESYDGRVFSAFEGIPYALPPVGELRFKEPQEPEKWDGFLYANTSYTCLQYIPFPLLRGLKGTEDCLYLYVYVPIAKIEGKENLDVIVYIHGGAFMVGSPKAFSRPNCIMDKDVIFVSLNYRLGILGFLSTQDDIVPGNNGLKDQVAALKWVKENIKHFGGNSDSITIIGSSAGGASVHYHYLSSLSRGLFHRGFSLSGTALQKWALNNEPIRYMNIVANALECDTSSSQTIVNCMKSKPANTLVEAIKSTDVYAGIVPSMPFGPVIETKLSESFLTENPYAILESGNIYDAPWITTSCIEEGIVPVGLLYAMRRIDELYERWDELMPYLLDITVSVKESDMPEVLTKLKEKYIHEPKVDPINVFDWIKLFTDRYFLNDVEKAVRLQAKVVKSPVYYYFFNYTLQEPSPIPFMRRGVSHGDDERLMFPTIFPPKHLKPVDEEMMKVFIEFLADFAANRELRMKDVLWRPVEPNSESLDFMHINGPQDIYMDSWKQLVDREFWDSLPIMENDKLD